MNRSRKLILSQQGVLASCLVAMEKADIEPSKIVSAMGFLIKLVENNSELEILMKSKHSVSNYIELMIAKLNSFDDMDKILSEDKDQQI